MLERLKSVMLISLVVSSIVLSRWVLYDDVQANMVSSSETEFKSVSITRYINPQSYYVSFGGMSYANVYDQEVRESIWTNVQPFITSALTNYEQYETIDKETYIEAFSNKSILLKMPLELRLKELFQVYSIENFDAQVEKLIPLEYLIVSDEPESLYLYDEKVNQYFKFTSKTLRHDVSGLISEVQLSEPIEYSKVSDRFSLKAAVSENENYNNYTLIPLQYKNKVPNLEVRSEVDLDSELFENQIKAVSRALFGNRYDFIKRLEDVNGSIIYMYGYGEKSLTISKGGMVSYNQKFYPNRSESVDFATALSYACGDLEQFGLLPNGLNLARYKTSNQEGNVRHDFYFNYKLGNYEIARADPDQFSIKVVVIGNQVVNIVKNVKSYVGEYKTADYDAFDTMYDVDECIYDNSVEVSLYYLQDNDIYDAAMNTIIYHFPIRSAISSIEMNYFPVDENHMIPVWTVTISERVYIFDAYTGEIIKVYR